uniref:Uncharacterized protein n=1 Tax=Arundo donax TaxID=35708 RepID=A0A0A9FDY1_ARUDO
MFLRLWLVSFEQVHKFNLILGSNHNGPSWTWEFPHLTYVVFLLTKSDWDYASQVE